MRVLGVDPGLTRCGVGVVEGVPGRPCALVGYYVVHTDPGDDLSLRLLHLDRSLADLVAEHRPQSVAVERVFSQHNVRTVMGTAQASAVAVLAGARAGLPVQTYTPSEVKAAITGSGQADKAQMTTMVTRLLRLDAPPRPADAADALALAICHIWRGGTRSRLAEAAERVRRSGAAGGGGGRSATARGGGRSATARGDGGRATAAGGGSRGPAAGGGGTGGVR
ncbi:crossover junction endodeoxyribonuclease RuvC [Plantactinospora sp. KBS50]|nr:crossover junction endodeoxyribonuclease RuvC [Plantactinospora sp. KBS50]